MNDDESQSANTNIPLPQSKKVPLGGPEMTTSQVLISMHLRTLETSLQTIGSELDAMLAQADLSETQRGALESFASWTAGSIYDAGTARAAMMLLPKT